MAYVSTAEVKTHLNLNSGQFDTVIDRLIPAATAAVEDFTSRVWESPVSAAKFYTVDRWDRLLDIDDAQSISEVAEKQTDFTWSALTADDWATVESDGPTIRLVRRGGCWRPSQYGEASVRVTGVFAHTATPPADVKEATLILCARLFQRKDVPLGFTAGGVDTAAMRLARTDPDVASLLQGKRALGVA